MRGVAVVAAGVAGLFVLATASGGDRTSTVYVKEPAPAVAAPAGAAATNTAAVPTAYRALVEAAGKTCPEVPAPILAAQLEAESQWNPRAVSPAGAKGIAQFMTGTWASAGVDGNRDGRKDPFDPADAIPAQAKFMCGLAGQVKGWAKAGRVKGDVLALTLAAYNAGGGNVLKHGGVPPFAETRDYVTKIPAIAKAKYTAAASTPGGAVVAAGGWASPLPPGSYGLSSGFGPRSSPGGIGSTNHGGLDLAAPAGTAILAAHAGRVTFAGPMGGYGHLITVASSADGRKVETKYGHMYEVGVKVGQVVKAGQRLAGVGSDGNSTGNHLHFEVLVGGDRVDPAAFLSKRGVKL